jgi:hypothetical protein
VILTLLVSPCRDVVSSVNWYCISPIGTHFLGTLKMAFLQAAQLTQELYTYSTFERTNDDQQLCMTQQKRFSKGCILSPLKELFTHAYRDSSTMLLGFGDGTVQIFDIRTKRMYATIFDCLKYSQTVIVC